MNTQQEQPLTTADLAQSDVVRGSRDGSMTRESNPATDNRPGSTTTTAHAPLFAEKDTTDLRKRWSDVQAGFVDEPRRAVEQADSLVADVMKRLAESFANERATLEHQWDRGDAVTTEDLRVALQRYRSFFDRLLTV